MYFRKGSLHKQRQNGTFDIKPPLKQKENNRVNCKGFFNRGTGPEVMKPNYRKPFNHWQNSECFKCREGQSG